MTNLEIIPLVKPEQSSAEQSARRRNLFYLNLPPSYSGDLDSFVMYGNDKETQRQGRILQIARRYLGVWPVVPPMVVFSGPPGTGKGHIAWALAQMLTEVAYGAGKVREAEPCTARVIKLPTMIREIRAAWSKNGPDEREVLGGLIRPDLLVIDEISRHAFYGEPRQHLYDVLDGRLELQRPTIMTTNEKDDDLHDILGPALYDRLGTGNGGKWSFDWQSYRTSKAAQDAVTNRKRKTQDNPEEE